MKAEQKTIQILKIEDKLGYFLAEDNLNFELIDKVTKEDILRLIVLTLSDETAVAVEEFTEEKISNPAHQIIYKRLSEKLSSLKHRKQEFHDNVRNLYAEAFSKYQSPIDTTQFKRAVGDTK